MLNILYTIVIYPLVQIIEFIFLAAFKVYENCGFAIIAVSCAITFFCLPLYIVAERWQKTERETIKRLKPRIDSIKAAFKGDEQYMMLSTYYRQNSYHPIYALRSSFGVLIQIPFFIAAYSFLSNLEMLKGTGFLFIKDLGAPDMLLKINVLPFAMTLINLLSCVIYTKGLSLRDKIQSYGMALIFLPLLYNAPSGLVLYWTMNNIFSLIKNIFYKLKKPHIVLYIIICVFSSLVIFYLLFIHYGNLNKRIVLVFAFSIVYFIPLFIKIYNFIYERIIIENKTSIYILSFCITFILLGYVTPSFVISSSPQEFSYIESTTSPFSYLFNCLFQAAGFFLFLPLCVFFLFKDKIKTFLVLISVIITWSSLVNTFCFSGNYGSLSSMLTFSNAGSIQPSLSSGIINLIIIFIFIAFLFLLLIKFPKILKMISIIMLVSLIAISIFHSITINREYARLSKIKQSQNLSLFSSSLEPIFNLSKTEKNIIIIFLDRGSGIFIPEIFKESADLFGHYKGFTYYPNTVSFSNYTLMGVPPVFGGYEYTPKEINKRDGDSLVQKHNESLLLMPLIFLNNGYSVTVTDPPWADHSWIPDTRIFIPYPDINVKNTIRAYTDIWLDKNEFEGINIKSAALKRNFIWFSLFKASPLFLRDGIYKNGEWWSTDTTSTDFILLLNNYAALDFLPELTSFESNNPTFTIISNDLPHEPAFLQAPDYVPNTNITNYGESSFKENMFYHVNAAAVKRLGEWFYHLQKEGCYDNTRIIITSDHGADIYSGAFNNSENFPFNKEFFNPVLMFKDFNSDNDFITDYSFMTNADTPILAFKDIIPNPFTHNPVNNLLKNENQYITSSSKWMPNQHKTNTFIINNDEWYTVHTDIFQSDNWQKAE